MSGPGFPVDFAVACRYWMRLGFISFGGPAGQIAIMHRELVEQRRWIREADFLHALNFCMFLPGPEAQQLAIYIGWLLHGVPGGIVAGALFVIPSIVVLLALSWVYAVFGTQPLVAAVFVGVKGVVVAIVAEAVLRIGKRALSRPIHLLMAGAAFVAIALLGVAFPVIVAGALAVGALGSRWRPGWFARSSDEGLDRTTTPLRRPARGHALRTTAVGLVCWALPFAALTWALGGSSLHVKAYLFFTKAALVTFGGAYSVLAYVTQAAVTSHGWLTRGQALDGLALAETTPGPLIMVLQFVGFMAGWNHPGDLPQQTSAVIAALVATWTTFLPSFVFVLLGAPWIEVLRRNKVLSASLSAVTAAVVGVILDLARVFAMTVVWPGGLERGTDWFALAVSVGSFAALYLLKVNAPWAVLIGAVIGLARVSLAP